MENERDDSGAQKSPTTSNKAANIITPSFIAEPPEPVFKSPYTIPVNYFVGSLFFAISSILDCVVLDETNVKKNLYQLSIAYAVTLNIGCICFTIAIVAEYVDLVKAEGVTLIPSRARPPLPPSIPITPTESPGPSHPPRRRLQRAGHLVPARRKPPHGPRHPVPIEELLEAILAHARAHEEAVLACYRYWAALLYLIGMMFFDAEAIASLIPLFPEPLLSYDAATVSQIGVYLMSLIGSVIFVIGVGLTFPVLYHTPTPRMLRNPAFAVSMVFFVGCLMFAAGSVPGVVNYGQGGGWTLGLPWTLGSFCFALGGAIMIWQTRNASHERSKSEKVSPESNNDSITAYVAINSHGFAALVFPSSVGVGQVHL
ncbi:hypothetical protein BC832DRAFT_433517 [Gaertneriomyces semiglobifer]|nr:hypothetical protein BC832DRAFT_433517 [Gaertneriomyces semiglobifer]